MRRLPPEPPLSAFASRARPFVTRVIRIALASDIHVVMAKKDNAIEYWAAATAREKAVAAVEKELPPGWTATLTRRHLTAPRATRLKMRPNSVRKL
jgi:hypothetical protein